MEILTGEIVDERAVYESFENERPIVYIQTIESNCDRQVQVVKFSGRYKMNPSIEYVSDSFGDCMQYAKEEFGKKANE
jgi:hypothetical protein